MKKGVFLLSFLVLLMNFAAAGTYFVSPTGSASWNSCTDIDTPCSLSAANSNAQAGDVVIFKDGDYTTSINPANSGTDMDSGAITFQSLYEWSDHASGTQYGPKLEASHGIDLTGKQSYLIFDGFGRDNPHSGYVHALLTDASDHIILRNCYFRVNALSDTYPILSVGSLSPDTDDVPDYWYIYNNKFDVIQQANPEGAGEMISIGSYEATVTHIFFHDNTIIDGMGHGAMILTNVADSVIYHNTFTSTEDKDSFKLGYGYFLSTAGGSERLVIEDNLFYEGAGNNRGDQSVIALHMHEPTYDIVRGNKASWLDRLFSDIWASQYWSNNQEASWNSYYHNTIYRAQMSSWIGSGVALGVISLATGYSEYVRYNVFADNIVDTIGDTVPSIDSLYGLTTYSTGDGYLYDNRFFGNLQYNISPKEVFKFFSPAQNWYTISEAENTFPSEFYDNIDEEDPKLKDPADNDFTLESDSPAIDAAQPLTYTNGGGSGIMMDVDDNTAYMFQAISGIIGWEPDTIYVDNPSSPDFSVKLASVVDYNTLELSSSQTWDDNAKIYWCPQGVCFSGSAPDIGAVEYTGGTSPCKENWQCTAWSSWSSCVNNQQTRTRTCKDANSCGTTTNKPSESETQPCSLPAKSYTILKTSSPPAIDGNLNEFTKANPITIANSNGNSATYKMLWDSNALYIAAQASDTQLAAVANTRDGALYNDDAIELFFDPLNNGGTYLSSDDYKFFVNLLNSQRDNYIGGGGVSWNAAFSSAVKTTGTLNTPGNTDTGYTIEIAIPWASWGVAVPSDNSVWGFDVSMDDRDDSGDVIQEAWSQGDSVFNVPDDFGDAVFSSQVAIPAVSSCSNGADADDNGAITIGELISYISQWKTGSVSIGSLMDAIGKWKGGC